MLMQIFPDIDAECNQSLDLRLSILCEKINMYMDHWDNDDEKCGEISDLIELLSHNPILDVIICDVDYTDTLSRLYDKAQDAGEKGNLPFFIKKAGLD